MGYEDPINPNYEATSDMYHRCLAECMERMRDAKALGDGSEKRVGIMVASHNADTIRFAIEKMKEYDIKVTFLIVYSCHKPGFFNTTWEGERGKVLREVEYFP